MPKGDNKCKNCGQFAGRGHHCQLPPISPSAAPVPAASNAVPTNLNVDDRVARAQAVAVARHEAMSGPSDPGLWGHASDTPTNFASTDTPPTPGKVTVAPSHDNFEDFCHVLIQAHDDPAMDNVSLPVVGSVDEITAWQEEEQWECFVLYSDGSPVGVISLHDPHLTDTPEPYADCRETDLYVLPQWRGKGLVARGFDDLEQNWLKPGDRLVAEIWETNSHSIHWHEKRGWKYEGTYTWEDETDSGPTRRYTKTI